jgi:hypothetical protein
MSEALPVIELQLVSGDGWTLSRARDRETGAARLVVAVASADLTDVRRRLAVAGSVCGPHLAPALDAVALGNGGVGVVLALPGGPSLAEVVARRGNLTAGEVVTLVVPLARTLAALRGRGVSVAGVDAACVWLSRAGRPVLLPILGGAPSDGDVVGLAALAAELLDRSSPGAAAVAAAVNAFAADGSDGEGLARALLRATPALPIAAVALHRPASRRRLVRLGRARPVVAVVVVALVAVGLGGLWARHDGGDAVFAAPPLTHRTVPSPSATVPSWLSVMAALERARARAYASDDAAMLDDVYANGSRVGAADRRLLNRMAQRKQRAVGLRAYVQGAVVLAAGDERVTLRVTDALTAYDVIGPAGHVLRHGLGRPARDWLVTLVRTDAGWRIWSISGQ